MEFIWRGSPAVGTDSEIFTHVLHTHYSAPQSALCFAARVAYLAGARPRYRGFDFEANGGMVTDQNVRQRAAQLASMLRVSRFLLHCLGCYTKYLVGLAQDRSKHYRTPNLLVTFGDDFKFRNARHQFTNMERLIATINADTSLGMHVRSAVSQ